MEKDQREIKLSMLQKKYEAYVKLEKKDVVQAIEEVIEFAKSMNFRDYSLEEVIPTRALKIYNQKKEEEFELRWPGKQAKLSDLM